MRSQRCGWQCVPGASWPSPSQAATALVGAGEGVLDLLEALFLSPDARICLTPTPCATNRRFPLLSAPIVKRQSLSCV